MTTVMGITTEHEKVLIDALVRIHWILVGRKAADEGITEETAASHAHFIETVGHTAAGLMDKRAAEVLMGDDDERKAD